MISNIYLSFELEDPERFLRAALSSFSLDFSTIFNFIDFLYQAMIIEVLFD